MARRALLPATRVSAHPCPQTGPPAWRRPAWCASNCTVFGTSERGQAHAALLAYGVQDCLALVEKAEARLNAS